MCGCCRPAALGPSRGACPPGGVGSLACLSARLPPPFPACIRCLQVGIVSHGLYGEEGVRHGRCGGVGQMDAYASVGAFREWIDATIKAEGF